MNYAAHYSALIERAKNRAVDGYIERHHIIPRCIGGDNRKENIVALTPEEHFVAHQLLAKLFPTSRGLLAAAIVMSKHSKNNKAFGWLKRRLIGNKYSLGIKRSVETRAKMSSAQMGNKKGWTKSIAPQKMSGSQKAVNLMKERMAKKKPDTAGKRTSKQK